MSKYPTPPFETKTVLIEDTFDPEKGPIEKVIDFNELDTKVLLEMAGTYQLAMDIVMFRLDQQDQKD